MRYDCNCSLISFIVSWESSICIKRTRYEKLITIIWENKTYMWTQYDINKEKN